MISVGSTSTVAVSPDIEPQRLESDKVIAESSSVVMIQTPVRYLAPADSSSKTSAKRVKRANRKLQNRVAAQASRDRKKKELDSLKNQVKALEAAVKQQENKLLAREQEIATALITIKVLKAAATVAVSQRRQNEDARIGTLTTGQKIAEIENKYDIKVVSYSNLI